MSDTTSILVELAESQGLEVPTTIAGVIALAVPMMVRQFNSAFPDAVRCEVSINRYTVNIVVENVSNHTLKGIEQFVRSIQDITGVPLRVKRTDFSSSRQR